MKNNYSFYLFIDIVLAFVYFLYIFLFSRARVITDIDHKALTEAIVLCLLYAFDFLSTTWFVESLVKANHDEARPSN